MVKDDDDKESGVLCLADGTGNDIWICGGTDTVWLWHTRSEARAGKHCDCSRIVYTSGLPGLCDPADAHCAGLLPVWQSIHDALQSGRGDAEPCGDASPQ